MRGAAAVTVAAAPVFSILRLIGSVIGVLLPFGHLTLRLSGAPVLRVRLEAIVMFHRRLFRILVKHFPSLAPMKIR